MKKKTVFIAIALPKNNVPIVLGVYSKKPDAEKHYVSCEHWVNIIEKVVE